MMSTNLAHLLEECTMMQDKTKFFLRNWNIQRLDKVPQQKDNGDCGILCAKFLEYDITWTSLDSITRDSMTFCRQQFSVQL